MPDRDPTTALPPPTTGEETMAAMRLLAAPLIRSEIAGQAQRGRAARDVVVEVARTTQTGEPLKVRSASFSRSKALEKYRGLAERTHAPETAASLRALVAELRRPRAACTPPHPGTSRERTCVVYLFGDVAVVDYVEPS